MNLDELLKVNSVRCIKTKVDEDLVDGEIYKVEGFNDETIKIVDRNGFSSWHNKNLFEPVPNNDMSKSNTEIDISLDSVDDVNTKFKVGDKVVINKISDDYVSSNDKNVKVDDVATVIKVSGCDLELSNTNWQNAWWFSKADVALVADNNPLDDNLLSHQEVIQAVIDGKELEIQYTDGTWASMSPMNTTLHQLTTLNFRLKPSLEDKRKAVIKKLLENKVAVICKCWDDDDSNSAIVAITSIDENFVHPYLTDNSGYKNAIAIDDNGNEITNV